MYGSPQQEHDFSLCSAKSTQNYWLQSLCAFVTRDFIPLQLSSHAMSGAGFWRGTHRS